MFFTIAGIVVMTNLYFFSLYLVYLSIYTWPIYHHFFCFFVIFFFVFPLFLFTLIFGKKILFLFFTFRIFITLHLTYLYHSFYFSQLHSFVI
jgi:hypothetical protein